MNSDEEQEQIRSTIQVFEGMPRNCSQPREASRWQNFLRWACPWLRHSAETATNLAERYAEATLSTHEADAEKNAQQAADLALQNDTTRHHNVKVFCDLVDDIFPDEPEAAKSLKLAKLLEANPQIAAQITEVIEIRERLRVCHGTTIEVLRGGLPELPKLEDGVGKTAQP
jgi:hypothetical protein